VAWSGRLFASSRAADTIGWTATVPTAMPTATTAVALARRILVILFPS